MQVFEITTPHFGTSFTYDYFKSTNLEKIKHKKSSSQISWLLIENPLASQSFTKTSLHDKTILKQ